MGVLYDVLGLETQCCVHWEYAIRSGMLLHAYTLWRVVVDSATTTDDWTGCHYVNGSKPFWYVLVHVQLATYPPPLASFPQLIPPSKIALSIALLIFSTFAPVGSPACSLQATRHLLFHYYQSPRGFHHPASREQPAAGHRAGMALATVPSAQSAKWVLPPRIPTPRHILMAAHIPMAATHTLMAAGHIPMAAQIPTMAGILKTAHIQMTAHTLMVPRM